MSTYRSDSKLFRTASLGLLAGCLWFSAGTSALAQEGQNNEGQDNAVSPQNSAQQARTDADIQSDVGYALTHDPTLQGQKITCATADGIVNLAGTVQTNTQRQKAETIAATVSGVSGVVNNIKVANLNSPEPPPPPDETAANTIDPNAAASQVPPPPPPDQPDTQAAPSQVSPGQVSPGQAPPPPNNNARVPYQPGYYPPPQQSYTTQAAPSGPVTIPAGTLVRVRLSETLDTSHLKSGTFFEATAANDVYQAGVLAIPRGAVLQGQVVEAKNAGELGGSAELQLELTGINLEGKAYPIATDVWSNKGPNKAGYTAANTIGGAALGAIIGGAIGGGGGAAVGAAVGGVGGLGISGATNGPRLILPAEAQVDFHLTAPATVQPVSWQEAQRLASSAPQQPRLVPRPYRPVPMYAPYPYPYYPYPAPYYAYPYPYYYGR
ncbi:MAG: BON domain-containing protein [Silvibacterium sp.]|nr:BON domain-containing protein [Silvibacterium sp.]MBV8438824.1 BON domain-containing protein [Silvibacterium sp.]